jgi:salicylate hydroxylase
MAERYLPILVAGGGIGGLAAALALAQKGRRTHVLEQAAQFGEIGAGIQLGPNVFRMFEKLGLTEAINRVAVFTDNLIMRDALSGDEVIRIPTGGDFRARFRFPYAVIHRTDVHGAILEACRNSDLITLSTSVNVAGYEEKADRVIVSVEGGADYEGVALIGADGLWSRIRGQLVGDGKPRVSGHIAYRAVIPTPKVPAHLQQNNVVLWAGPRTHLVHYPLRRGELYNLVVVFHSSRYEEGWDTYGDPEELQERFKGQRPEVLEFLSMVEAWRMWVLCDREPIKLWSSGRVVLLGDAAHPMLQYLAQGACMAIEDAMVLADCIEKSKGDHASAFAVYQQARYLRTARVQLMARFYGELYHATDVKRDLRNALLAGATPEGAWNGAAWLYEGVQV